MPTWGAERPTVGELFKLFLKQTFRYEILSLVYSESGKETIFDGCLRTVEGVVKIW